MARDLELEAVATADAEAEPVDPEQQARREFLKKAGKVAMAAPALALILRAESVHARGFNVYRVRPPRPPRPLRRSSPQRRGWFKWLFDKNDRG